MQYCVDHPEEINQLAKVKAQVSEVKGVMMQNIEKVRMFYVFPCMLLLFFWLVLLFLEIFLCFHIKQVLDRGEKIELLVDKTDSLRSQVSSRNQIL